MSKHNNEDDIAFIKALAEVLQDHNLGEIEVERERGDDHALSVRLSKTVEQVIAPAPVQVAAPALAV